MIAVSRPVGTVGPMLPHVPGPPEGQMPTLDEKVKYSDVEPEHDKADKMTCALSDDCIRLCIYLPRLISHH